MGYWSYSELKDYGVRKPPKPKQILKGDRRRHVINRIMDELRDWRSSPFEYQGAIVAGLRSGFCLEGHGWFHADHEASTLVLESLRALGAERPTWDQGQPEYVTPRENCLWCGNPIDEDDLQGKRNPLYCSDMCAHSALQKRYDDVKWWKDNKGWAAFRMIDRKRQPERECKTCGGTFRIERAGSTMIYCSHKCSAVARKTIPDRTCRQCKQLFRPAQNSALFCGRDCFEASIVVAAVSRQCVECGVDFLAKTDRAEFCCRAHMQRALKRRKKIENPPVPKARPTYDKHCIVCEQTFVARNQHATMCSTRCKSAGQRLKRGRGDNVVHFSFEIFDSWFQEAA